MFLSVATSAFCISLVSAIFLVSFKVDSLPVDGTNYELSANYFEGDMILSGELQQLLAAAAAKTKRKPRNALIHRDYRWPHGIMRFDISNDFTPWEVQLIHQSMQHISSHTCVRFQHVSQQQYNVRSASYGHETFAFIRPSRGGCSAAVGYQNSGVQYVNLVQMGRNSIGCFSLGIIVHELLHALGIYHQHSSSNRDDYVRIRNENIQPGTEHNFLKLPHEFAGSFGVDYDYSSLMHYSGYAFSRNGQPTIETLQPYAERMIGQRRGLSQKDISKIQRMYECGKVF